MKNVRALVLRAPGTNCDEETAEALRLAGAQPEVVHIHALLAGQLSLASFQIFVIPGGFSYGDDVAAGKILANELRFRLREQLLPFVAEGRKVIGICNGFQVLVRAGLLPGSSPGEQTATLTLNDSGRFQCHWVTLQREKSACRWLNSAPEEWPLPIAHGEGKFVTLNPRVLDALETNRQVVFRYRGENPNGSVNRIAGICNPAGNVVGLMPHPERHVLRTHHPEWTRRRGTDRYGVGLEFFRLAVADQAKN